MDSSKSIKNYYKSQNEEEQKRRFNELLIEIINKILILGDKNK